MGPRSRVCVGLGRRGGVGGEAAVLAFLTHLLFVPEHVHLVARGELRGDARARVLPRLILERLAAEIGLIGPLGRIARVPVLVHVHDVVRVPLEAQRAEEPESVARDRTAERVVEVVGLDERIRRREPCGLELVGIVAALQVAVSPRGEAAARQSVASGLRHDIHHRPARLHLAQTARCRECHFLCVSRVGQVVRAAGLGHRDADAVHQQARLAIGPPAIEEGAVRAEGARVTGPGAHVLLAAEDGRDEHEECIVGAGRRNRGDDFVCQHGLPLRALNVNDRCLARHGDGLLDAAHFELRVDRHGQERIQLETRAAHRGKAWQHEGDYVLAGPQVLDAIHPRAVGDGRSNLLDEGRARGLDRDAGQDRAGRVPHRAGDRALRMRQGRQKGEPRECRDRAETGGSCEPGSRRSLLRLRIHRSLRHVGCCYTR